MVQRSEQGLIQEFIAQAAVEAFDEGILRRLSGRDIMPVKLAIIHELQDRVRGELGPVVFDNRLGLATGVERRRQLPPTTSNGIIPPNACRKLHNVEVIAPTPRPCKAPLQRLPDWRSGLPDWAVGFEMRLYKCASAAPSFFARSMPVTDLKGHFCTLTGYLRNRR
jgi:hypothetical protein